MHWVSFKFKFNACDADDAAFSVRSRKKKHRIDIIWSMICRIKRCRHCGRSNTARGVV